MLKELLGLWCDLIKKARGTALLFIIACIFLLTLSIVFKSEDSYVNYLIFGMAITAGLGALGIILFVKMPQPKRQKSAKQPKSTLTCSGCGKMVTPVKIGRLYRCPVCPYEFKPLGQRQRSLRKSLN